jgi:hypothetical protein
MEVGLENAIAGFSTSPVLGIKSHRSVFCVKLEREYL